MTLRGRLTLAFLLVVLGPILLSSLAVGIFATGWIRDNETTELDDGVSSIDTTINSLCQQAQITASGMALGYPGAVDVATSDRVLNWAAERVDGARVLDSTGRIVAARGQVPGAMSQTSWGECATSTEPSAIIAASAPIVNATGETLGTVQSAFRVDDQLVEQLSVVSGLSVAVTAPDGAELGQQPSGDVRTRTINAGPAQPLQIGVSTPQRDLKGLYVTLVVITLVVAGVAVLAARWLARSLTLPIAELAHAAEEAGVGNLSTRVPVRGGDETAQLARNFNRMIHDLERYVGALRSSRDQLRGHLASLGQALSSGNDQNAILELTVQTAMAATGAHAGVVLLTEPGERRADPPVLVGKYAQGLPSHIAVNKLKLPFGKGLLGNVAATGTSRRGRVTPGQNTLSPAEPACRTFIAVPFLPPEHVGAPLGVLVLYDRLSAGERTDDFDDADLETVQSFATQAAAALGNSQHH